MAVVSLLGTATFNTTSGTKTVTATPAVNDLIVIITAHTGNTSTAAPTDNNSSGTYSLIGTAVKATSADTMRVFIRDSFISSAVSTIFTHAPGASSGGGLAVFKVTGMSKVGASADLQFAKQDNQAAGTPAPAFTNAVDTNNPVIGAVFNATNPATMTQRASFTEAFDVGYNTPTTGLEGMFRSSGETGTTMTWGSASGTAYCSLVLELDTTAQTTFLKDVIGRGIIPFAR
jgi:hypothetical protein